MSPLRLSQINLVCGDLEASLAFYRALGAEIPPDQVWRTATGPHHARAAASARTANPVFELDSSVFAQAWNPGWAGNPDLGGRIVLGFSVDTREEVDALFARMIAAGHPALQAPHDAIWGARYAIIEDPDGVAVGLMSPISPDRRTPPPDL